MKKRRNEGRRQDSKEERENREGKKQEKREGRKKKSEKVKKIKRGMMKRGKERENECKKGIREAKRGKDENRN